MEKLKPCTLDLGECNFVSISFTLVQSMVDGKFICASTGTSTQVKFVPLSNNDGVMKACIPIYNHFQSCYKCGATLSQLNDPEQLEKLSVEGDGLNYGLSGLHASIEFLNQCLKLGYNKNCAENNLTKNLEENPKKKSEDNCDVTWLDSC